MCHYLLPDPDIAGAEHGAGDRHHAHVGNAARVVGGLHPLPAQQQLLQPVLLGQLRHLGLVNGENQGFSLVNGEVRVKAFHCPMVRIKASHWSMLRTNLLQPGDSEATRNGGLDT